MRWLGKICFLVLASGMAFAQAAQNAAPSDKPTAADEIKALRDAVAQQQQLINQQQQQIDALKKSLQEETPATPHVEDAAIHANAPAAENTVQGDEKPKESPLSFRIGGTEFTPGGFVDFENIFRSTNATGATGNPTATSFGAIPFSNTVQGHLTEYRATGQYSRFNLKITGQYGANNLTGYIEGDFNGNDPTNVFVTSNSHTARLRLYWLDLKRGQWEFLGGQSWGLMTPNRVGVSPMPQDLLITYNEDANIQVGTNYTRAGTFRGVWHPSDNFAWAFGIENPNQFVGTEVIFPAAFNAQLAGQFDNGALTGTPNVGPDFVSKLAIDGNPGGRHMHFEVGGIMNFAKLTVLAPSSTAGATFVHNSSVGAGLQSAFVLSVTKNFRVVGNGLWGPGMGRELIGLAPQVIVVPTNDPTCAIVAAVAVGCGASISPVHAGNGLLGLELQATPKSLFGAYYGGMYAQRNFTVDTTATTAVQPFIGFGFPNSLVPIRGGSANSNNRAIQEATFDWTQTFWRNPQYGAVLLVTQYSYVTRSPWFVAAGAPKNAHVSMGFVSMRYVLP